MKNLASTLFLASVFAFSATNTFAGDIPMVGRTCPPNTTCITEGEIPIMGKTCPPNSTCLTDGNIPNGGKSSVNTQAPAQAEEPTIFKTLLDYLGRLFG